MAWRHRRIGQSLRNSTHGAVETGLAPSYDMYVCLVRRGKPVSTARPVVCYNTSAAQPQCLRPVSGTAPWCRKYHGLVQEIPRLGTACTTAWYYRYHAVGIAMVWAWRHRRIGQSLRNSTHGAVEMGLAPSFCLPCFMEDVASPSPLPALLCVIIPLRPNRNVCVPSPVPRRGTINTTAWYYQYHGLVLLVPRLGTIVTTPLVSLWYGQAAPAHRRSPPNGTHALSPRLGGL